MVGTAFRSELLLLCRVCRRGHWASPMGKGGLVVCIRAAFDYQVRKGIPSRSWSCQASFLMGERSNTSCMNKIYYCLSTCLGDQGPNSQSHLVRSGSPPDLGKYALWRRRGQVPVRGQVRRHVDLEQVGISPSNNLSGIFYHRF